MIEVSNEFVQAVADGRVKVMLRMGGRLITGAALAMAGIEVAESLGPTEAYSVGNAPAGTVGFELWNEDGRFSGMSWGECIADGYAAVDSEIIAGSFSAANLYAASDYAGEDCIFTQGGSLKADDGETLAAIPENDGLRVLGVFNGLVCMLAERDGGLRVFGFYIGDGTWDSMDGIRWGDLAEVTWAQIGTGRAVLSDDLQDPEKFDLLQAEAEATADGLPVCGFAISGDAFAEFAFKSAAQLLRLNWESCPIGVLTLKTRPDRRADYRLRRLRHHGKA